MHECQYVKKVEEEKKAIMDKMLLVAAKRLMVVMLDAMMLRLTPTRTPSTTFPDPRAAAPGTPLRRG